MRRTCVSRCVCLFYFRTLSGATQLFYHRSKRTVDCRSPLLVRKALLHTPLFPHVIASAIRSRSVYVSPPRQLSQATHSSVALSNQYGRGCEKRETKVPRRVLCCRFGQSANACRVSSHSSCPLRASLCGLRRPLTAHWANVAAGLVLPSGICCCLFVFLGGAWGGRRTPSGDFCAGARSPSHFRHRAISCSPGISVQNIPRPEGQRGVSRAGPHCLSLRTCLCHWAPTERTQRSTHS